MTKTECGYKLSGSLADESGHFSTDTPLCLRCVCGKVQAETFDESETKVETALTSMANTTEEIKTEHVIL